MRHEAHAEEEEPRRGGEQQRGQARRSRRFDAPKEGVQQEHAHTTQYRIDQERNSQPDA